MARLLTLSVAWLLACFAINSGASASTQYVECGCSASRRGFMSTTLEELKKSSSKLAKAEQEWREKAMQDKSITETMIQEDLESRADKKFGDCTNNWSIEVCVNADTFLRRRPNARTFCRPNTKPDCSTVEEYASTDPFITGGKPEVSFIPPQTTATTPPTSPTVEKKPSANGAASEPASGSSSSTPSEAPKARPEPAAPPASAGKPVRTPTPGEKPAALPIPERGDEGSNKDNGDAPVINDSGSTGDADISVASGPADNGASTGDAFGEGAGQLNTSEEPKPRLPLHEGCVAVEHMYGLRKQHRSDLTRTVLCGRGFCATPNHAIIVDGSWTSLKRLCAGGEWQCVQSVKKVNNLDVFANRRARVGDITITPYDLRFPRAGVWFVQALERMLLAVVDRVTGLFLATLALAIVCRSRW